MLTLQVTARTLHKAGNRTRHFEDAFAFDERKGRAAVADGATDAFEAGIWARILVSTYVLSPPEPESDAILAWLQRPARAWLATINKYDLSWYAEQKAMSVGGLATLCGFCIQTNPQSDLVVWESVAIGDACILHLRHGVVVSRFPLTHAHSFDSTPALVSSIQHNNYRLHQIGEIRHQIKTCQVNDVFLLATDAMAQWLYTLEESAQRAEQSLDWNAVIASLESDFEGLLNDLRGQHAIRNDDVTLLIVRVVEKI